MDYYNIPWDSRNDRPTYKPMDIRNLEALKNCETLKLHYYEKERENLNKKVNRIDPFQANVPFLKPIKTSENQGFSDVFWGNIKRTLF